MYPKVADPSGEIELQTFDSTGQALLGTSANELEHLRHTPGLLPQFQAILQAACSREFTFECHTEQYDVSPRHLARSSYFLLVPLLTCLIS